MFKKTAFLAEEDLKKVVVPLYLSAFPESERPPVDGFFASLERKENQLFLYYDDDVFIGFTYLTFYQDVCFLFFLAVKEDKRGQGYGGKIIEDLKETYQDHVILLFYEEVNPQYSNYQERVKREHFYLSHGFKDNELKTDEFGVVFQSVYIGHHTVSFETYVQIFVLGFGEYATAYIKEVK